MLSTNKLKVAPKAKNASPRACTPETQQPAPAGTRIGKSRALEILAGESEALERQGHLEAIQAALSDLDSHNLMLVRGAIEAVKGHDGTFLTPFETLVVDLLWFPGIGKDPANPQQVETIFEEFRDNWRSYLNTARHAMRKYPDLVEGGGE